MRLMIAVLLPAALLAAADKGVSRLAAAAEIPIADVEGQPLAAQTARLLEALRFLGADLPARQREPLRQAIAGRDGAKIQRLLDPHVLLLISINPEVRVKVERGPAAARLQQAGYTPVLLKILNDSSVTRQLRINSPQSGAVYAGASLNILQRQRQTELNENPSRAGAGDRFLDVDLYQAPPMTRNLSGLEVEYAIGLIYSSESGKREATIGFDVGAGTQDIGFRGEAPVLFDIQPAIAVRMDIRDADGQPSTARLTFTDQAGRICPPQPKRLAPDFFFQPQIYRHHGEAVLLPPGKYVCESSRGPEYRRIRQAITITDEAQQQIAVRLQRWVEPMKHGFYCGDHHIHGAGCSHYTLPTEGVRPEDMFRQVKGEGLNVGCVLTWGPCFDFQRRFFSPTADAISEPLTLLKYDLEISGFGSAALGHVCLLNLKDQTYPQSEGSKDKGWPTWTVPVMRWCKQQGGVTGYPHSAMHVNPQAAAERLIEQGDRDRDGMLSRTESAGQLLPATWEAIDGDRDGRLAVDELRASIDRAADQLPNLAVPEMNGAGAMEIFVSGAEGVCDFVSAMDTARIPEWNTWYHLMNCGLPIKLSGETDFPCMSSRRVGQGRVYVQLGDVAALDFEHWCRGLAEGRSYVSDGFAHALDFRVGGRRPGPEPLALDRPQPMQVRATVAFAAETPRAVAYGLVDPPDGRRMIGDTIQLHGPRSNAYVPGGKRLVELVQNGRVVAQAEVAADGQPHELRWEIEVDRSSWIALRQFPQLHTNPVIVQLAGKPVRTSADSARWCLAAVDLLWKNRHQRIAAAERPAARAAYDRAIAVYQRIADECDRQ